MTLRFEHSSIISLVNVAPRYNYWCLRHQWSGKCIRNRTILACPARASKQSKINRRRGINVNANRIDRSSSTMSEKLWDFSFLLLLFPAFCGGAVIVIKSSLLTMIHSHSQRCNSLLILIDFTVKRTVIEWELKGERRWKRQNQNWDCTAQRPLESNLNISRYLCALQIVNLKKKKKKPHSLSLEYSITPLLWIIVVKQRYSLSHFWREDERERERARRT